MATKKGQRRRIVFDKKFVLVCTARLSLADKINGVPIAMKKPS